jgi:hypothetical protein
LRKGRERWAFRPDHRIEGDRTLHRIIILVHRRDPFREVSFFMREIADIWQEQGLRVNVPKGPEPEIDADLAILHVDLTVVPDEYSAFVRRYPVSLNGSVRDISKRVISANLVHRDDGYPGPVIVKTNLNCAGCQEARLAKIERARLGLLNLLPWRRPAKLSVPSYTIFGSVGEVPGRVWKDPNLVVERFLPERRDGKYCLRTWVFLGDRETNSLCYSEDPVIKSTNVLRRETVAEVPDELRQTRRRLDFDFGKFDYAIVDGQVVLYDANSTPTLGRFPKEQFLPGIRVLAEGIRAYL